MRILSPVGTATLAIFAGALMVLPASPSKASEPPCVNIFHDESGVVAGEVVGTRSGPERTIVLANLMGHFPHYEVRVRPIWDYYAGQADECHATFYIGTAGNTNIPQSFLTDFFLTKRRIAWIGLGSQQLDQDSLEREFRHRVGSTIVATKETIQQDGFFDRVEYKGGSFVTEFFQAAAPQEPIGTMEYQPVASGAGDQVIAWQVHSKSLQKIPYVLRADNKFLISDVPFEYYNMWGSSRYMAVADILFDILDEKPLRNAPLAMGRLEDVHGFSDLSLVEVAMTAFRDEDIPINIVHIPVFVDPSNSLGRGATSAPVAADSIASFRQFMIDFAQNRRNTIIWHGVTHQFGTKPNPFTGTSGQDFEFWDKVNERPIPGDSPEWVLDRLSTGVRVFDSYGQKPRFWIAPHYEESAVDNAVFGRVFPWVIGRVAYFASSVGNSFTLRAGSRRAALDMPGVDQEVLDKVKQTSFDDVDRRSNGRIVQMFPFEIYRDIYGQRVIPETIGFVEHVPDFAAMRVMAERNSVVRDVWASFFFHPFLLVAKREDDSETARPDASDLRHLISELKGLGYKFISLEEFEGSIDDGGDVRIPTKPPAYNGIRPPGIPE